MPDEPQVPPETETALPGVTHPSENVGHAEPGHTEPAPDDLSSPVSEPFAMDEPTDSLPHDGPEEEVLPLEDGPGEEMEEGPLGLMETQGEPEDDFTQSEEVVPDVISVPEEGYVEISDGPEAGRENVGVKGTNKTAKKTQREKKKASSKVKKEVEETSSVPLPPINDETKRWYVVKVQSGREDSIKEAIERRVKIEGLEEFFGQILIPMEKETVLRNGKRVVREKKKFPGYVMAQVDFNDQILYLFRETSGVGDFVGGGPNHAPLPMSAQEVDRMIGPIKPGGEKDVIRVSPFNIGERVKVKDGVFKDMEGDIKEILEAKGEVRIELFVLGRPVLVELEYWQVESV